MSSSDTGETAGNSVTGSNPDPLQQSFADFEPSGEPIAEYLSDIIRLPGYGRVGDGCEGVKAVGFCENGHVQIGSEDPCGTRTCPICWGQWRKESAASVVARLAAFRAVQGDRWDTGRRMLHVVSSPEQEQRWSVTRFWNHRSDSYEPVEAAGGRGGVCIAHPYGTSEEGDDLYREAVSDGLDPEYGKWRLLRGYADEWEEMKPLIEVRPHFHQIVGAGDFDGEAAEEIEAETGWMVRNIRSLGRFFVDGEEALPALTRRERAEARRSEKPEFEALKARAEEKAIEGYEDMARLTMYLLSHGAVQPEVGDLSMRATVTYWGEVHPNGFDPEEELSPERWAAIQRYARAAVGLPEEDVGEEGTGRCCSREGCEAAVRPLSELSDRLGDPDHSWWDSLGFEQQCELLGVDQWAGHKPPPGAGGDLPPGGFDRTPPTPEGIEGGEEFIEWLRRLGRRRWERRELPFLTTSMSPGAGGRSVREDA